MFLSPPKILDPFFDRQKLSSIISSYEQVVGDLFQDQMPFLTLIPLGNGVFFHCYFYFADWLRFIGGPKLCMVTPPRCREYPQHAR